MLSLSKVSHTGMATCPNRLKFLIIEMMICRGSYRPVGICDTSVDFKTYLKVDYKQSLFFLIVCREWSEKIKMHESWMRGGTKPKEKIGTTDKAAGQRVTWWLDG